MEDQLSFGNSQILYTLRFKERKTLGIKVFPDGKVEVLAPLKADKRAVTERLRHKAPWILKQLEYFNSYKPATPLRRYINGETHLYLGRQYKLKIIPGNENIVKVYRGQLWMYAINTRPDALKKQLDSWYRHKADLIFNELIEEVIPKFRRYKINRPILTIRFMTKRWGSCTPTGKIILNTELIKAPKGCIEYVIIHELSHLVHHNHKKAFQSLLNRILPDWKKWKEKLEYSLA